MTALARGPVLQRSHRRVPRPIEGGCHVCCSLWEGDASKPSTCRRCGSRWAGTPPYDSQARVLRGELEAQGWGWVERAPGLHVLVPPGQQSLALVMEVPRG